MPTCTRLTQKTYTYSLLHLKWKNATKKGKVWKSISNLSFESLFSTKLGQKDPTNKIDDSISISILILERLFSRKLGKRDLENKINDSISISNFILVGLFSTKLVKRDLKNKINDWDLRINKWQSKCNRLYCKVDCNTTTYSYLFSEWRRERKRERERERERERDRPFYASLQFSVFRHVVSIRVLIYSNQLRNTIQSPASVQYFPKIWRLERHTCQPEVHGLTPTLVGTVVLWQIPLENVAT